MRIGRYDLYVIETGRFGLDGGAMFGVVPRTLWEKGNPPDERNRIAMATRSLLLRGDNRTVLIDTGNGSKFGDKLSSIYRMDFSEHELHRSLAGLGIAPADITDVILTHLHFDHAGGSTYRDSAGLKPTFPNATYHVQREHWEAAMHPTERDRASFFPDDYMPLHAEGMLRFAEGEGEILPDITVRLVHGHTTALQCPLVSDGTTTLLYCADLIPLAAHVQLPWIMAYDLRPLVTLEEKRRLLGQASEEDWILFLEHDPLIPAVRVNRSDRGVVVGSHVKFT